MLCVRAKFWYTAMINGNCRNRTVVKHGMMSCCLLCATTGMLDFLLAMTFQSFCSSQSIPVINFQYWSCKSWVSVLVLDIKVLVLEPQSLGLGFDLGEASLESKSGMFWPRNDLAPLLRWRRHCVGAGRGARLYLSTASEMLCHGATNNANYRRSTAAWNDSESMMEKTQRKPSPDRK